MGWSWPALGELRDAQGHDGGKSPHIPIPWPPRHSSLPVLSLIHMLKPPHLLPSLLIPDFSEPLLSPTLNSSLPTTCYSLLHPPYTFPEGHLCGSGPWSPSVPPELFYSTPNYKQFPVPREAPPMKPGLSWARNNKEQQAVQPPMPEAMEERGAHHKQLNITLVKVSEGTDTPHEDNPTPKHTPPPSTIKYNKLQKDPLRSKRDRQTQRQQPVWLQSQCPQSHPGTKT